jgi:hypothetical protein
MASPGTTFGLIQGTTLRNFRIIYPEVASRQSRTRTLTRFIPSVDLTVWCVSLNRGHSESKLLLT